MELQQVHEMPGRDNGPSGRELLQLTIQQAFDRAHEDPVSAAKDISRGDIALFARPGAAVAGTFLAAIKPRLVDNMSLPSGSSIDPYAQKKSSGGWMAGVVFRQPASQ